MSNDMALARLETAPMVENPLGRIRDAIKNISFELTVRGRKVTPANAAEVLAQENLATGDRQRIVMALEGVRRQNRVFGATLPLYPNERLIDAIPAGRGAVIPILENREAYSSVYDGIEGVNPADTGFIEMPPGLVKVVNGLVIAGLLLSSAGVTSESVGKAVKSWQDSHPSGPQLPDLKEVLTAAVVLLLAACQKAGIIPTNTPQPQLTSTPTSPDTQQPAVSSATPSAESPKAVPTPLGINVPNAGGPDSGIIITGDFFLPENIDPSFLANHRIAFRTLQERIGYGFCTVINENQQGPCYDVVGSLPGNISHNGQDYAYDSTASRPGDGLYVYIGPNDDKLLNIGTFKHQEGFTLIQAVDQNGNLQTHLVGPDGKVKKLFDLVPLGINGTIVSIDWANGTITLSTGEVVSLVTATPEAPITLPDIKDVQTYADCPLIENDAQLQSILASQTAEGLTVVNGYGVGSTNLTLYGLSFKNIGGCVREQSDLLGGIVPEFIVKLATPNGPPVVFMAVNTRYLRDTLAGSGFIEGLQKSEFGISMTLHNPHDESDEPDWLIMMKLVEDQGLEDIYTKLSIAAMTGNTDLYWEAIRMLHGKKVPLN